jgi:2-amino-4-hydroxy-6-hydroxymethyldihydropteridine diphosphokinase
LLYGDSRLNGARLTLPHPRMHERAFVLKPLLEIAPHLPFEPPRDQKVERID